MLVATAFPSTASGANEVTPAASVRIRQTSTAKPTASAATTAELTERLKEPNISPASKEIVRMSEAGTDSTVIQAYVENSTTIHSLRAEDIIYLHEHGIPGSIITAMIQRAGKLREETAIASAAQSVQPAPMNPAPAPAPGQAARPVYVTPPLTPSYAYASYPNYVYNYPNVTYIPYSGYGSCYSRPYYYSSPYFGLSYSFGGSYCRPFGYGFSFGFGHRGYGGHCW